MRKILAAAVLTVAISMVAFSQADDGQIQRGQSEQLIAMSQEFVKTSIIAVAVEMGEEKMTPSGLMSSAEVKEQWEAVGIRDAKVRIEGDHATVTGEVIFRGQVPQDKTHKSSNPVTIHFFKRKGQWKLVSGCFGKCDGRLSSINTGA